MHTVLGLDVGAYSLKAVLLRIDEKSLSVVQALEKILPAQDPTSAHYAQALQGLLLELSEPYQQAFTGISSRFVVTKNLVLPHVKRRDVDKLLENELEDESMVPFDELCFEYQIVNEQSKSLEVLAFLARRVDLRHFINLLDDSSLNARVVDVESGGLLNALAVLSFGAEASEVVERKKLPPSFLRQQKGFYFILDVGHRKTTLTYFHNHKILRTRTFLCGGYDLTLDISQVCQVDFSHATQMKHQADAKIEPIVLGFLKNIGDEVLYTLKIWKEHIPVEPETVYLMGGSCLLADFSERLSSQLKIKCQPIIWKSGLDLQKEFLASQYAIGLGYALRTNFFRYNSRVNWRRGEFAPENNYAVIYQSLRRYSAIASVVLGILLMTWMFRVLLFDGEVGQARDVIRKTTVAMMGGEPLALRSLSVRSDFDPIAYGKEAIRLATQDMESKSDFLNQQNLESKSPKALRILSRLSMSIPKDVYFEIVEFRYSKDILTLTVDSNSVENINKAVNILTKINEFTKVDKKNQDTLPGDTSVIRFILEIRLAPGV